MDARWSVVQKLPFKGWLWGWDCCCWPVGSSVCLLNAAVWGTSRLEERKGPDPMKSQSSPLTMTAPFRAPLPPCSLCLAPLPGRYLLWHTPTMSHLCHQSSRCPRAQRLLPAMKKPFVWAGSQWHGVGRGHQTWQLYLRRSLSTLPLPHHQHLRTTPYDRQGWHVQWKLNSAHKSCRTYKPFTCLWKPVVVISCVFPSQYWWHSAPSKLIHLCIPQGFLGTGERVPDLCKQLCRQRQQVQQAQVSIGIVMRVSSCEEPPFSQQIVSIIRITERRSTRERLIK